MKTLPAGLQTALQTNASWLGWLVLITRRDGTQIPLSTIGAAITVNSVLYPAANSFIPSDPFMTFNAAAQAGTCQIIVPTGTFISESDVNQRLYDDAEVEIRMVAVGTLDAYTSGFRWYIGAFDTNDAGIVRFDIQCDTRKTKRLFLKRFGVGCSADLGDSRCGVNVLGAFTDSVAVLTYVDRQTITIGSGGSPYTARADNWYNYGAIKFTSGANEGYSYTVRDWTLSTGTLKLMEPLRGPVAPGDLAQIHAGCDWKRQTCHTKFNNVARYQGFDYLPDDRANFSYEAPPETAEATTTTKSVTNEGSGALAIFNGGNSSFRPLL